ncbi:MAG TPA: glycine--tRNA ligase subunit beta [Kofleriaceae bacterium]|nr:glycine--tRNA ligase subunit beta [Kofleriaceae bacterium]
MPADLLFEIGSEEIPAKMLAHKLADLPATVEARLAAQRLEHKGVRVVGTPRRIAVIVKQLADRQPDLNEEVVGPPVSAAFAADGSVTRAGQGFAAKNGVEPSALQRKEVPGKKGLYAVAVRSVVGRDTRGLLPELLAELARSIQWPKSQRWGWSETTYVRPVQWLVALYGGEVVPMTWAGLSAGRTSRGHRFLAPGPVDIASPDRYAETLRQAHVVVDPESRRELVQAELARLAAETGLRVRPDDALLGEVIHLGEYPVGVCGAFDPAYLEVPEEVIVTAMRTHQRYFALEDAQGKLANRFATLMATVVKDPAVVRRGNEKVLAARLADARFFFAEDRKKSFEAWNEKLDAVVFQDKLGPGAKMIGHKVHRIEAIARALATHVGVDVAMVSAAARVCKADLASHAVGEFPELQGVMGRHYARCFGLPPEVGAAIDEHWWPKGQGAALPPSAAGAILAIADRMDTLVGCYAVGLEPTGSADPLGLRRAAIGIWQILLARGEDPAWASAWRVAFDAARNALADHGVTLPERTNLVQFFVQRLRGIFVDQGIAAQDADAALVQRFEDPLDALARANAIGRIPREAREVFKRVANILDDARAKQLTPATEIDPAKFVKDVESNLLAAITDAQAREAEPRKTRDYARVLDSLVQLQPAVAAFFDKGGVMVMDPDPALRDNRLALLTRLIGPYMAIADFRLLGATTG